MFSLGGWEMITETTLIPEAVPPTTARRLTRRLHRMGGRTTAQRHGSPYMVAIGRRGGQTTLATRGLAHMAAAGVLGQATFDAKYSREVRVAIGKHTARILSARPQLDRYFTRLEVEPEAALIEVE